MRPVVAVTFRATEDQRAAIEDVLSPLADVELVADLEPGARDDALRRAGALLSWGVGRELPQEQSDAIASVRLVQLLSAGADSIPYDRLPASAVVASNVGAYAEPMGEHVLAMALALLKRLPQKHAELARGEFNQRPPTRRVDGTVWGILGFGGIGTAVAWRARPLGARIHAVNTSGRTDERVGWVGTLAQLDDVLRAADVLVVALPLTRETRGLIGERELRAMKRDAVLVNVARGPIVEQRALYEHLRANPAFTAGIDAWWTEPFRGGEFRVEFPFFELPNVLGSPHNSAIVPGIEAEAARRAAENVARFLRGEPVRGVVRREDYD